MNDWNPALYTRFEAERTRPAAELLARVPLAAPRFIADLGCGPGNSTELLATRYPNARIVGIDTSQAMLASARVRLPALEFQRGDIAQWQPAQPLDLAFANASLQWLPEHERVFPALLALLAPGGVLAVQMPDNDAEPTHVLMRETAADPRFAAASAKLPGARPRVLSPLRYYDLLAPHAEVEIWRTTYFHPLAGAASIVQWLRSTGLRPFLEPLSSDEQARYLGEYEQRVAAVYPQRADGLRVLQFPRLFIVARRSRS
ncbi:MAG TPA: trans-aconitate 2-methyltransferase [Steroidobacteraceae bacterium]|nr:trans-aconitate 2-methyltransferase [Steroidobacteraceae bacterium]